MKSIYQAILLAALCSGSVALGNTAFNVDEGMDLGVGYDSLTGKIKGDCIAVEAATFPTIAGGATTFFSFERVTSHEDLRRELNVDAAASVSSWLGASASAKAKFADSVKVDSFSLYAIAKVVIRFPARTMPMAQLKEPARALIARSPAEFHRMCGDEYVHGFFSGGEIYGVFEFRTNSADEQRQLETAFNGSFGNFSTSAELTSKITSLTKHAQLNIHLIQNGGDTTQVIGITPEAFLARVTSFAAGVTAQNAYPYEAVTRAYKFLALPNQATTVDLTNQRGYLADIAAERFRLMNLIDRVAYVLEHQEQFVSPDVAALNAALTTLHGSLNGLRAKARACHQDYTQCTAAIATALPQVPSPARKSDIDPRSCATPLYREGRSLACGIESYLLAANPDCGIAEAKVAASQACGVKEYVYASSPNCGPARYKLGRDKTLCGQEKVGNVWVAKQCRHEFFGVEMFMICPHPAHGIVYKTCADPSHGVTYKSCRTPANGVETFKTCRLPEFGVEACTL